MPPPNYLTNNYLGAMDQSSYFTGLDAGAPVYMPDIAHGGPKTGLSIRDLGMTLHPMRNQLQELQAKIREGASKVEFEFAGRQKGNAQSGTPEMYGKDERELMRQIAELNKIKSSTHATFSVSGLAGFGQRGFTKRDQNNTIHEVQRAIDFAKDATTGGAIVVHTGEWQRPIHHHYGQEKSKYGGAKFKQYEGEEEEEQLLVVDGSTGEFIQDIAKNKKVTIPKWHTAQTWQNDSGQQVLGEEAIDIDGKPLGRKVQANDYVDQNGRVINIDNPEHLFRRVPVYDEKGVKFETDTLDWKELVKRTEDWNSRTEEKITPEEYYAKMQIDNQILSAKGNSLYHLRQYENDLERLKAIDDAIKHYRELDENLDEDQKWRIMTEYDPGGLGKFGIPQQISIPDYLEKSKKQLELSMRHVHEASSASDARAKEMLERRKHITTVEKYGLKETGRALGKLGLEAMEKTKVAKQMRKDGEVFDDMYIAPENVFPGEYGSHPDELLKIVKAGRQGFVDEYLGKRPGASKEEAEKLAKKHIKTTFDIGHLNMWRHMMEHEKGETEEQFQERFNKWVIGHLNKLKAEDAIGHLHVTDNFGYNDDHVTPGQGKAPVKEFIEWAKKNGHKDFIIESGSFNGATIMHDTWSYLGAVPWKSRSGEFTQQHHGHSGWYAPPNYIVGSYVPSNEWTLWSGVPLE